MFRVESHTWLGISIIFIDSLLFSIFYERAPHDFKINYRVGLHGHIGADQQHPLMVGDSPIRTLLCSVCRPVNWVRHIYFSRRSLVMVSRIADAVRYANCSSNLYGHNISTAHCVTAAVRYFKRSNVSPVVRPLAQFTRFYMRGVISAELGPQLGYFGADSYPRCIAMRCGTAHVLSYLQLQQAADVIGPAELGAQFSIQYCSPVGGALHVFEAESTAATDATPSIGCSRINRSQFAAFDLESKSSKCTLNVRFGWFNTPITISVSYYYYLYRYTKLYSVLILPNNSPRYNIWDNLAWVPARNAPTITNSTLSLTFKKHSYAITLINYYAGSIFTYSAGMFIPNQIKLLRTKERKHQIITYLRSLKKKKRKQERKKLGITRWKCLRRKLFIKLAMTCYVSFLLLRCMPRFRLNLYVRGLPSNFLIFWKTLIVATRCGRRGKQLIRGKYLKHQIDYIYFRNRFVVSKTRRRLKRRLQRRLSL